MPNIKAAKRDHHEKFVTPIIAICCRKASSIEIGSIASIVAHVTLYLNSMAKIWQALREPRLLVVLLQGFSSGLPLLLVGGTMKGWLADVDISLSTIGLFAAVGLPYTCKFLWSPLMDRFVPPLGRRRGWLLITQLGLVLAILGMATIDPVTRTFAFALAAFVVAFLSASQDIVIDAYRREILPDEQLGLGSSLYVLGYRAGLLAAGSLPFILAETLTWSQTYMCMGALALLGLVTTLLCREPKVDLPPPRSMREAVVGPLRDFFTRDKALLILAFILFYKVGESMASDMLNPMYVRIGIPLGTIGTVAKTFGFASSIVGALVGGLLMVKIGIYRGLWIFGILQTVFTLMFSYLAMVGPNVNVLIMAVTLDSFAGAMATTAFVGFMASQTNRRFTATQYALLSSLMGVPRVLFGYVAGVLAEFLGWELFFVACVVFAVPGLLMLFKVKSLITTEQK